MDHQKFVDLYGPLATVAVEQVPEHKLLWVLDLRDPHARTIHECVESRGDLEDGENVVWHPISRMTSAKLYRSLAGEELSNERIIFVSGGTVSGFSKITDLN